MKKHLLLLVMTYLLPMMASADVVINQTNFPNRGFRQYLLNQPYGSDEVITDAEIATINTIDINLEKIQGRYYYEIGSFQGIEYFTALTKLDCRGCRLKSLDVSQNTALTDLNCNGCNLTSLDLSKNTALTSLDCIRNQLTTLDLSKNTALTDLLCDFNQLTSLDLSKNTALNRLECQNNQLSSLDLSKNTALSIISCSNNQLTSLDVSKNTALTSLGCQNNQLSSLDLSMNTTFTFLECSNNQLTSLSLPKSATLEYVSCYNNRLTSLDASNLAALRYLYCYNNQLTSLDVSNDASLTNLDCNCNSIYGDNMDKLIKSMPTQEDAIFTVYNADDVNERNICTKQQVEAAKAKGWKAYYINNNSWEEYAGNTPSSIEKLSVNNTMDSKVYTLGGQRMNSMQKGLNIVLMKDGTIRKIVLK